MNEAEQAARDVRNAQWQAEWDARQSAFKTYERYMQPFMNVPRIVDDKVFEAGWNAAKDWCSQQNLKTEGLLDNAETANNK